MNELINALAAFGLEVLGPVLDGTVQRCRCRGSKQKSGWYVGNMHNDHVLCSYGDWRSGEKGKYTDNGVTENSETISVWRLLAEAAKKEREELHRAAAKKTEELLTAIPPLTESRDSQGHPYLEKKGISAHGEVRVHKGNLVIPLRKPYGSVSGYQTIDGTGNKKFL